MDSLSSATLHSLAGLLRYFLRLGDARGGPFIAVNCAALPTALVEAELFGVQKGAFTDAQRSREGLLLAAAQGTLFLDEIAELPADSQGKLLHVLESGSVRPLGTTAELRVTARLLAATNQPLDMLVQEKRLRADL